MHLAYLVRFVALEPRDKVIDEDKTARGFSLRTRTERRYLIEAHMRHLLRAMRSRTVRHRNVKQVKCVSRAMTFEPLQISQKVLGAIFEFARRLVDLCFRSRLRIY